MFNGGPPPNPRRNGGRGGHRKKNNGGQFHPSPGGGSPRRQGLAIGGNRDGRNVNGGGGAAGGDRRKVNWRRDTTPAKLKTTCGSPEEGNVGERKANRKQHQPGFGFGRLKSLLSQSADNVILFIHQDISDWKTFLESEDISVDCLILLGELLGVKVCSDSVLSEQQVKILTACCSSSKFVQKLRDLADNIDSGIYFRYVDHCRNMPVDVSPAQVMSNLHQFCAFVLRTMPAAGVDYLKGLIGTSYLASQNDRVDSADLVQKFKALRVKVDELVKSKKTREENGQLRRLPLNFSFYDPSHLHNEDPPNSIQDIDVIPGIAELRDTSDVFLRPNIERGAYKDSDHYLDVQFRLFREDFVQPLRKGVSTFLENKIEYLQKGRMPIGDLRLYTEVTFLKVVKDRDSIVHKLQLAKHSYLKGNKSIPWNKSKRLLPGSLVILTTADNCFEVGYTHFGVVFNRNYAELEKGILTVTWEGASPVYEEGLKYLMFESEVYLESRRYTLEILKELNLDNFPMKKFIVDVDPVMNAPKYLQEATRAMEVTLKDGRAVTVAPLSRYGWPTAAEFGLDENQLQAYKAALTKEFTIIQGPPGTGKTYLGLKVADVLLRNQQLWRADRPNPITVVCYTNHALDQFLEGIIDLFQKRGAPIDILRIGGNSKSDVMQEFSLSKVRSRKYKQRPKNYSYEERKAKEKVLEWEEERAKKVNEMEGLGNIQGIVDFKALTPWQVYGGTYSSTLWVLMQDLGWFDLGQTTLRTDASAEQLVRNWFRGRIREAPKVLQVAAPPPFRGERQPPQQKQVLDDEDDEEEDMEEVMKDRVFDDSPINYGYDMEHHRSEGHSSRLLIKCIPNCSVRQCDQEIRSKREILKKAPGNMDRLLAQRTLPILEKRRGVLQKIFQLQKDKLLDLPDVRPLQDLNFNTTTLNRCTVPLKWAIYFSVVEQFRKSLATTIAEIDKELGKARKEHRAIIDWGDSFILQDCLVVGLTTTGAAKYNNLLKGMKSKIVIVEEAAQVFEAQVVTCITDRCEQLIMIGDHLQLRPSPTVFELGIRYHLDISLFERMVKNNLHCHQLRIQHRMRPDIADLTVGPIYKELLNGPKVLGYPSVTGLAKNLFFVAHNQPESSENDSKSRFNTHEEKFLVGLCRYLTLQGYKPEQITVLTMYTGQMFNLRSALRKTTSCQGVRVTNVDNFQGEENDIILLSLVRSNEKGVIGFLNIDNRVNVALSRARHGLFIVGNMDAMVIKSKTWQAIRKKLEVKDRIGPQLELQCQVHQNITRIRSGEEFLQKCPEGGCTFLCAAVLPCTHVCKRVCHVIDKEPEKHKCEERCLKICANKRHQCQSRCYVVPCPPCSVPVLKTLRCELGHQKNLPCHQSVDKEICYEPVKKLLECGHEETLACHVSIYEYKCQVTVKKKLGCKHEKEMKCYEDPGKKQCTVQVEKILQACGHLQREACWKWQMPEVISCDTKVTIGLPYCDHKITVKCAGKEKLFKCTEKCKTRLACGHACDQICHGDRDPHHRIYDCPKRCQRECSRGHKCKLNHPCHKSELCPPCQQVITMTLPCGHSKELACHQYDSGDYICTEPCTKILPGIRCLHQCPNLCYQPCGPCTTVVTKRAPCTHGQQVLCGEDPKKENCLVRVPPSKLPICGHPGVTVPCQYNTANATPEELAKYCDHPCNFVFAKVAGKGCDHPCAGTCSSCLHGRVHLKCQAKCGRSLVCGHRCDVPCSAFCPPCQKPCHMKCEHSDCKNKCGELCSPCKEPCTWRCPHTTCSKLCGEPCNRTPCDQPCPKIIPKCGHNCVGFCGEPCPPLCRICDKEELEETMMSSGSGEEVEDARFVFLADCPPTGHTIEVTALETWLNVSSATENEDGSPAPEAIAMKICPLCKTPIRNCRRFGNLIRKNYLDVIAVKQRALGNMEKSSRLRDSWIERLKFNEKMKQVFSKVQARISALLFEETRGSGRMVMHKKLVDEFSMNSLDFILQCADKVAGTLYELGIPKKLEEAQLKNVLVYYRRLFHSMLDRHPLSHQEVVDFNGELDRLDYYTQLMVRRSYPNCHPQNPRVYPTYQMAKAIVMSVLPFSALRQEVFKQYLKTLDQLLSTGLQITDRERQEIIAAFDMLPGHWFKCPNGHIYAIGECGGAMERARCPEPGCGAEIGGANHQVVRGNQLAGEMDGATRPAFETALQYYD